MSKTPAMPVLLRLRLIPYRNTSLDAETAPAQGWFFSLLSQIDPAAADAMHVPNRPRSYAVAPFHTVVEAPLAEEWRKTEPLQVPRTAEAGRAIGLRVGLADADLARRIVTALTAQPLVPRLSGTPCVLARVPVWNDPADLDLWEIPWPALVAAPPAKQIRLSFVTPTFFNATNNDDILFPEPRRLWESWQRSWRTWTEGAIPLPEVDPAHLRVARYRLQTEVMRLKGGLQRGFVGELDLDWGPGATDEERRTLSALAGLANLTGTGARTALGMGQTRALIVAEEQK